MTDKHFMEMAIREAQVAFDSEEVPVGSVIVSPDGKVIARAHNLTIHANRPTAHAEILAINIASDTIGNYRLSGCTLYVSKEPCIMCAGAIVLARIPVVVFGVADPLRGGAVSVFNILNHPQLNHRPEVIPGIMEISCRTMLQDFFRKKRNATK